MSVKVLLDDQIDKLFEDNPELKIVNKNQFEVAVAFFSNLKYLHGLDSDDLIDGIMGDGGDEGIDHCYVFCNGFLVSDENFPINKESHVKVKFFQTKKENGFKTDGFRKLKEGIEEIFDLELSLDYLENMGANRDFLEKTELIRKIFRKASRERAKFSCEVFYVTAASDKNISEKIEQMKKQLQANALKITYDFYFWSAQDVLNLAGKYDEKIELRFNSQPLEVKERDVDTNGFCGFVSGNKLVECLLDDKKAFKSHLTEGNVRFFLGEDKKINASIIETAKDKNKSENFWAMNNGLTIIGESIEPLGNNQYSILNPQIVNGCQTIHCLYYAYKELGELPNHLKVFVKIISSNNIEIQTDIISATNSQNPVKSASLKANDNIQRNIEKHLEKSGIFYERRENYYKRLGFSGNKVVGLLKMAQIMHSVINKESVFAINDTTSLFETESKYNLIFNESADFDIYTFAVNLYQKIWTLKNSDIRNNDYTSEYRDIISKSGFIFLHLMSTLILSDSYFGVGAGRKKEKLNSSIQIGAPFRKNEFSKRKDDALIHLDDELYIKRVYGVSKDLLFSAAGKYSVATGKSKISLLKNRGFDRDYLRPEIDIYLSGDIKS